jgi:hypothetical protein
MRGALFLLLLLFLSPGLTADEAPYRNFFLEPELMIGKNIPVYDEFPHTSYRRDISLNLGYIYRDSTRHWVSFYHYPTIGISATYSDLGNAEVLSKEYSLIPYIIFKTSGNPRRSVDFRFGLGVTYCTNPYDEEHNPENLVLGSNFNWGFRLFIYKNLIVSRRFLFRPGLGYLHASNGHTVLPNYGLNSVVLSLAFQFPQGDYDPSFAMKQNKLPIDRTKHYFMEVRTGLGWHKLGGTTGPIGNPTYLISSTTVSGGIIVKQQVKLHAGLGYRYYSSFYNYIQNTPDSVFMTDPGYFRKNPGWRSSNLYVLLGGEFLIGHFGLDLQGSINFYKPFFREFNERWEFKKGFFYDINRLISTRMGLKYYVFDTSKMPRHNVWAGTHINANLGKADFMDVSVGYCYVIR